MAKLKDFILFLWLLQSSFFTFSQNINNTWISERVIIEHDSYPPVVTVGSPFLGADRNAAISDSNGDLLFYTNGSDVYNKLGNIMPNGHFINGIPRATSCLIIPKPSHPGIYILFTNARPFTGIGLNSIEIDMNANSGLGDVLPATKRNILLDPTEKLAGTKHVNGVDYWISTTREVSGNLEVYTWEVTSAGVSLVPNVFVSGHVVNSASIQNRQTIGKLQFSRDGCFLISMNAIDEDFDLFSFDSNLGNINSFITTYGPVWGIGAEFSPNGKYVYTARKTRTATSTAADEIIRFDLSALPVSFAPQVVGPILPTYQNFVGDFLLSPDESKILVKQKTIVPGTTTTGFGVINFPNDVSANFVNLDITLHNNPSTGWSVVLPILTPIESCYNCQSKRPAEAIAEFVNEKNTIQLNSKYGKTDVALLCLTNDLLVDGSKSKCEDRYFVGLSEFDLTYWNDINVLHSNWISPLTQAPSNIRITDFLPQGYQLRPNIVYRFRLAVGIPWDSTDIFFMIDCCGDEPEGLKNIKKIDTLEKSKKGKKL